MYQRRKYQTGGSTSNVNINLPANSNQVLSSYSYSQPAYGTGANTTTNINITGGATDKTKYPPTAQINKHSPYIYAPKHVVDPLDPMYLDYSKLDAPEMKMNPDGTISVGREYKNLNDPMDKLG